MILMKGQLSSRVFFSSIFEIFRHALVIFHLATTYSVISASNFQLNALLYERGQNTLNNLSVTHMLKAYILQSEIFIFIASLW